LLFAILVLAGISGSSIGATATAWVPERPYTGALLRNLPIPAFVKKKYGIDKIRKALLEVPRKLRSDEYYGGTPFALSQLAHSPRFPVVNTNIGADGQNMLVTQHAPVLHLATLGRPATWGYFSWARSAGSPGRGGSSLLLASPRSCCCSRWFCAAIPGWRPSVRFSSAAPRM
jgi:hypothetical protein